MKTFKHYFSGKKKKDRSDRFIWEPEHIVPVPKPEPEPEPPKPDRASRFVWDPKDIIHKKILQKLFEKSFDTERKVHVVHITPHNE